MHRIAAGVFVAEYRWAIWARIVHFLSDVLVGVPSAVLAISATCR
jgi:ABC-type phosphate transport system permease subunit